jgi:hypothetical protein
MSSMVEQRLVSSVEGLPHEAMGMLLLPHAQARSWCGAR